jgi:hypothetical protein
VPLVGFGELAGEHVQDALAARFEDACQPYHDIRGAGLEGIIVPNSFFRCRASMRLHLFLAATRGLSCRPFAGAIRDLESGKKLERQRELETCPSCGHGSAKIPGSHASPRLANQEKTLDITTILADPVSAQDAIDMSAPTGKLVPMSAPGSTMATKSADENLKNRVTA